MSAEERLWATWVVEEPREGVALRRLICVLATSEEEAREESGLVFEDFHLATPDEERLWDRVSETPFTEGDIQMLLSLLRRKQRALGRERLKRPNKYSDVLWRARKYAELHARLETFEGTSDGDDRYDW